MARPATFVGQYRVREGDTFRLFHLESVTNTLFAFVDVLYDNGTDERIGIAETAGVADRTTRVIDGERPFRANGWIVQAGVMIGPTTKRGQAYVILASSKIPVEGVSVSAPVIAAGYVYDGHIVPMGENTEPGPGGGEGFTRVFVGADPAAQTEANDAVPANAVWRLISYQIPIVGIAADTAAPRLIMETPTRVRKHIGGLQDAIAGAETQTFLWTQGYGNLTLAAPTVFTDTEVVSVRAELPSNLYLVEGDVLRTLTAGVFGATSNYGTPIITVEEWLKI